MSELHVAGLVLARGGSKSIPRKNTKLLNGRPLISWALQPMLCSEALDSVWVSTEDDEIAGVSHALGARLHRRPKDLAADDIPSIVCVQDFLRAKPEVTHVALVQCTSPCLQPAFLREAREMIIRETYDSVFSVARQFKFRWSEGRETVPLNLDPRRRPRRQDWIGELVESGHFYMASVDLVARGYLQGGKCGYVEIPTAMCFEIDNPVDWMVAEVLVKAYGFQ